MFKCIGKIYSCCLWYHVMDNPKTEILNAINVPKRNVPKRNKSLRSTHHRVRN